MLQKPGFNYRLSLPSWFKHFCAWSRLQRRKPKRMRRGFWSPVRLRIHTVTVNWIGAHLNLASESYMNQTLTCNHALNPEHPGPGMHKSPKRSRIFSPELSKSKPESISALDQEACLLCRGCSKQGSSEEYAAVYKAVERSHGRAMWGIPGAPLK